MTEYSLVFNMKTKFPKPKKSSRKSLIKKLDKIVSQIVIKRDGYKCVQCHSTKQLTCGHVFSRSHYSTRWDLLNCHCQCWADNFKYKTQDTISYYQWFVDKFGQDSATRLYNRWKKISKFSNKDLEDKLQVLINHEKTH